MVAPAVDQIERQLEQAGARFSEHAGPRDGETGVFQSWRDQAGKRENGQGDLEELFQYLGGYRLDHPAHSGEIPVEGAADRQEWNAEGHQPERTDRISVLEPVQADVRPAEPECQPGEPAKKQAEPDAPAHGAAYIPLF